MASGQKLSAVGAEVNNRAGGFLSPWVGLLVRLIQEIELLLGQEAQFLQAFSQKKAGQEINAEDQDKKSNHHPKHYVICL